MGSLEKLYDEISPRSGGDRAVLDRLARSTLTLALLVGMLVPGSTDAADAHAGQPNPHYGPVPPNCPPSVPIQHPSGGINHAFGSAPLWISPYSVSDQGQIHLGSGPNAQYEKAIWQVGPALTAVITIRGWNLATGKPVRFGHTHTTAQTVRRLDPGNQNSLRDSNPGRLLYYGGYLFFPSAGCYVLAALWKHGAELYPFAVGR